MKKLIEIQLALKAPKSQFNSFGKYKYRNCEDILEALKPLLAEKNCLLTITDEVKEIAGTIFIEATATIQADQDPAEKQSVKACAGIELSKKGMDLSQSFGASSSYARKYALNGLFLIDDTKDADATNDHDLSPKKEIPAPTKSPFKPRDIYVYDVSTLILNAEFKEWAEASGLMVDSMQLRDGKEIRVIKLANPIDKLADYLVK
jgi:hypothetical protein